MLDDNRFLSKLKQQGECWVWTGNTYSDGYGRYWYNGKNVRSHRFAYFDFLGREDNQKDLVVCHFCHNPLCVYPPHLVLGTQSFNIQTAFDTGRKHYTPMKRKVGSLNSKSKLSEEDVEQIKREYATGNVSQRELAKRYNVSKYPIWSIINGIRQETGIVVR